MAHCAERSHIGERSEGDLLVLQRGHDGEQVRQRPTKSIQLPDDEHVAGAYEFQRLGQARSIIFGTGGMILEQVTGINARRQQRIALQVCALSIRVRRNAHVANQHKRITIKMRFPYVFGGFACRC